MLNNIRQLYSCACGEPGSPFQVVWQGDVVAHGPLCPRCRELTGSVLDRVRPIYHAIVSAGLGREIASATLTFMLDQMDRAGEPTGAIWP